VFLYICVLFLLLCYLIPIFAQDYRPLPPGGNQIAVNNYRHRHHHLHHHQLQQCLGEGSSALRFAYIAPLVSVFLSSAQRFEAFWSSLPNPPFKPICTKVALVKKIESSVHMSPRHRSMLLGVRSGSTRRHVTFCICVMALNFILTSVCLVAMQCLRCVYSWYLPLVLLSLSSSSLWERAPYSTAAIRRQTAHFYSADVKGCRLCLVKLTQGLWDVNSSATWVLLSRIQPWKQQNATRQCVIQVFYWEAWAKKCVPLHAFTKSTLLFD
jgi:hypothetical protein